MVETNPAGATPPGVCHGGSWLGQDDARRGLSRLHERHGRPMGWPRAMYRALRGGGGVLTRLGSAEPPGAHSRRGAGRRRTAPLCAELVSAAAGPGGRRGTGSRATQGARRDPGADVTGNGRSLGGARGSSPGGVVAGGPAVERLLHAGPAGVGGAAPGSGAIVGTRDVSAHGCDREWASRAGAQARTPPAPTL